MGRNLTSILFVFSLLLIPFSAYSQDDDKKSYGIYKGTYMDVITSTQEIADVCGPFLDDHCGKKFKEIFGEKPPRAGVLLGEADSRWNLQKFTDEETKRCKQNGAEFVYRGPEDYMHKIVKKGAKLQQEDPQAHFLGGTFLHYFGATMISNYVYLKPEKDKRKENRERLEKRWDNKYLLPFWFVSAWTIYSEPDELKKQRWNNLNTYMQKNATLPFKKYFRSDFNNDWILFYAQSLAVFEYLVEMGGPTLAQKMMEMFIDEKGMDDILKWISEHKEDLGLKEAPSTMKEFEADWLKWVKARLSGKKVY